MIEQKEKLAEIKDHWQSWADEFGSNLRATTKSSNIKKLEIEALGRCIEHFYAERTKALSVLEAGCGNGINAISLAEKFGFNVDAFDYIDKMVDAALDNLNDCEEEIKSRIKFSLGDVQNIESEKKYDVIYTCRCLINLPSWELQKKAIHSLLSNLKPGGILILIENFVGSHAKPNEVRESLGLPTRKVAEFNRFFIESEFFELVNDLSVDIAYESNFSSLHDILQYVIVPMINNGDANYDHEVMDAVTAVLLANNLENQFSNFGQNKLFALKG